MEKSRVNISPFLLLMLLLVSLQVCSQPFRRFDYLPVTHGNIPIRYPWTGGVNSVQFGKADVNNDGKKDIVLYDKTNKRYSVFLTQSANSASYQFESSYASYFPAASGWVVLKDYNCDGIEDLFTYNGVANIKVYTGYYANDTLHFRLQQDGFYYRGNNILINTYCADVIKPAIADINKDGDLDLISFNVFGDRLIYYENQQKELGLPCDSLFFTKADNCWGNVRDSFASSYALRDTCSSKFNRVGNTEQVLHTGSTIDAADIDNNGALDVLIGSVSLSSVTLLYNKGTTSYASILKQDITFPSYNVPFEASSFATPTFMDADNDGKTDLLISTFDPGSANIDNIWFYKNTSTDSSAFVLQQKNFLLDNMIDAGENSSPCILDVNGDGLKDILVGSGGLKDNVNPTVYKILYYKNTGTSDYPKYNLEDDDFLDISTFNVRDLVPAAGDIDNDSDTDIVIGLSDGRIIYWENTAAAGNAPNFVFKSLLKDSSGVAISIGANASPYLADINKDGRTDLIIGERNGNLNYYTGNGSNGIHFSFVTDSLGKVRIRNINSNFGFTQPCIADVNADNKYDLILGTNLEGILLYDNIEEQLDTAFTAPSLILPDNPGFRTTAVAEDITGDGKPELLTGSLAGGLIIFSQDPPPFQPTLIKENISEKLPFTLFPNPVKDRLFIQIDKASAAIQLQLFNLVGQVVLSSTFTNSMVELNIDALPGGLYVVRISDGKKEGIGKVVIQH